MWLKDEGRPKSACIMDDLYTTRLLELASDIPHQGRLDAPDASVKRQAKLCGSTIEVDLSMKEGRVLKFAQDVEACALGKAAAAVLGRQIIGLDGQTIRRGRNILKAILMGDPETPSAPWKELQVFNGLETYKHRHGSVMLAFEAVVEAIERIERTVDHSRKYSEKAE